MNNEVDDIEDEEVDTYEDDIDDNDDSEEDDSEEEEVATSDSKQSKEDNSKFAKARREAEAETERVRAGYEAFARRLGYKSFSEMEEAQAEYERTTEDSKFEETHGVSKEAILPIFEELKKGDPDFQELQRMRNETKWNTSITQLHADFPELKNVVKTIDDAEGLPNIDVIKQYIQKGVSLSDAYFMANKKDILSNKSSEARVQAIKSIQSKNHIKPTGSGVEASYVKIPAQTMDMYKQFFPKWSEKQIREHYAKGDE